MYRRSDALINAAARRLRARPLPLPIEVRYPKPMRALPCSRRPLGAALALGPTLLARAEAEAVPWITASLVSGPAIVLGAVQRAGRVVDLAACAAASTPVLRRATTGTAAYLASEALLWTLALPHLGALVGDTRPETLLNRNVRPFLKGFARAGAAAHYFGREWIAVHHRPGALLGFDVAPSGAVLIEVIAGYDAGIAIPERLAALEERSVDRWRGKAPASLLTDHPGAAPPLEYAGAVIAGVAERAAQPLDFLDPPDLAAPPDLGAPDPSRVIEADDPIGPGFEIPAPVRCPIGWLDVAFAPGGGAAWVGGDLLAPRHALQAVARAASGGAPVDLERAPIEGWRWSDVIREASARRSP